MTRKALAVMVLMGWLSLPLMAQEGLPVSGLIVKLKKQQGTAAQADVTPYRRLGRVAYAAGYTSLMPWRTLGPDTAMMQFPTRVKKEMAERLMSRALASGEIEWVEPNVRQKLQAVVTPNDPYYTDASSFDEGQWWLQGATTGNAQSKTLRQRGVPNIDLAWQTSTGQIQTNGTIIAVLDTGKLSHPDIDNARMLPGYDFVSEVASANDGGGRDADATDPGDWVTSSEVQQVEFSGCDVQRSSWHGLVIQGFLAARSNNGVGVAGINWNARILPVRVAGKCGATVSDIVDGMRWAAGLSVSGVPNNPNPAKIINISFGGDGACGQAYQSAINEVRALGVIVVAAAGNEHHGVSRPGNCSGVVTVAALNREGFKSSYSNFGAEVFVSTIGGDPSFSSDAGAWAPYLADTGMLGVYNDGLTSAGGSGYAYHAGSSYSAPVVAGVLSLMLDVNPGLTVTQLEQGLRLSARPHVVSSLIGVCSSGNPGRCVCSTSTCGYGMLDAEQALVYAAGPSSYVAPSAVAENIDAAEVAQAVAFAAADRSANPATTSSVSNTGSGGGGGSFDETGLLAGVALMAVLARQRFLRRRASR